MARIAGVTRSIFWTWPLCSLQRPRGSLSLDARPSLAADVRVVVVYMRNLRLAAVIFRHLSLEAVEGLFDFADPGVIVDEVGSGKSISATAKPNFFLISQKPSTILATAVVELCCCLCHGEMSRLQRGHCRLKLRWKTAQRRVTVCARAKGVGCICVHRWGHGKTAESSVSITPVAA